LGWARWTDASIRVHRLPGRHADFVKPPVVNQLAALLQASIDGAGAD
jgi:thioesterase domain-containing protein